MVHLSRRVVERNVLPLVPLPDFDKLLAMLAEAQGTVGADDLALVVGRAVGETDRDCDAGEAVLVADERGGGVVAGLVVGACAHAGRDRNGLGSHQPGEAVDDVNAVGQPHAAAVEAAAVLRRPAGVVPVLGHVADDRHQRA